jgi:hypothetical protein
MSTRSIRSLAILAGAVLVSWPANAAPSQDVAPPPAAPSPAPGPGGPQELSQELAEARSSLLEAEQELREANAALARAQRGSRAEASELERLNERQQEAQEAFDEARSRLPDLMVRARAAGVSAAVLRAYQHSLYGN